MSWVKLHLHRKEVCLVAKAKPEAQIEAAPAVRSDPGKLSDAPDKDKPKIIDLGGGTIRVDN